MKNYLIVSEKEWNAGLVNSLQSRINSNWDIINNKSDFNIDNLKKINPEFIFFPHWSYIIPPEIFTSYECVVFHETDLPFGRGGSPIQNLIEKGYTDTKISALKVSEEIDAGCIYCKEIVSLLGTAEEIFIRINKIVEEMIYEIISNKIIPQPQVGEPSYFVRRKPGQSNISNLNDINDIFNYIRMLDAEGYPKAFLETELFKFEFSRASLKTKETIIADVRITKK